MSTTLVFTIRMRTAVPRQDPIGWMQRDYVGGSTARYLIRPGVVRVVMVVDVMMVVVVRMRSMVVRGLAAGRM